MRTCAAIRDCILRLARCRTALLAIRQVRLKNIRVAVSAVMKEPTCFPAMTILPTILVMSLVVNVMMMNRVMDLDVLNMCRVRSGMRAQTVLIETLKPFETSSTAMNIVMTRMTVRRLSTPWKPLGSMKPGAAVVSNMKRVIASYMTLQSARQRSYGWCAAAILVATPVSTC